MRSREMGERGEEGVARPVFTISRPRVKTRSKPLLFGLLAKEGAVLQSIATHQISQPSHILPEHHLKGPVLFT